VPAASTPASSTAPCTATRTRGDIPDDGTDVAPTARPDGTTGTGGSPARGGHDRLGP
jgi:hypothetical protein